ncbi:MAG: leucyl aminopeptidase [Candidatus Sungiibacteriota bacterium]
MGEIGFGSKSKSVHVLHQDASQGKVMKIVHVHPKEASRQKAVFLPLFQKETLGREGLFSYFPEKIKRVLNEFAKKEFTGEEGETKSLWLSEERQRIILFGLGEKSKWNERKNPILPRQLVRYAKKEKISEFASPLPLARNTDVAEAASSFAANAVMADYEHNRYRTAPKEGWPEIRRINLFGEKNNLPAMEKGIAQGIIVGEETNLARELANTPGGDMTPRHLAEAAKRAGRKAGFRVKILDERAIKKLGMGGVLGVAKGSAEKPRFIILEYLKGAKAQKPLVLVGKGVTFDTGGLNLKPEHGIYEMHMDMSGGAAVIHGMAAIARLKLPINLVGLIPAVENMPSGSSYRPGDVLKTMSGKTIEVLNTDAEGRVILSDALYYGTKYKPGLMIDFATLTGAAHVALGNYASALFYNREKLAPKLVEVGRRSGDYVWPLPLWDEYLPEIKGTFGDLANIGKGDRYGGAIHGAKFLEQFVGETPWAHVDIAPKMTTVESEHLAKGASGVGVRYIVELAKDYPELLKTLTK